ncbi:hypothetical protein [Coralliovum pocilloporae]|uniref:hypothetical protein n=1 Tax=Coralliovum pocilloporae TaxID=3066369 RepID=UPI0033074C4C
MLVKYSLLFGGFGIGAAVLLFGFFPAQWTASLLGIAPEDAADVTLKRYGASASAALLVLTICAFRNIAFQRALLLGFATWFCGQALAAAWAALTLDTGPYLWLALVADPALTLWFFRLFWRTGKQD